VISYNNIASIQSSTTAKLFTLAIILSPIFRQYIPIIPIPGVTLADMILGISCGILLLTSKLDFPVQKVKHLILFWFFGATVSFFSFLIQQELNFEIISRLIRYSFYVFLVLVSSKYFQLKYALKIFKFLCIIISLYIIAQTIIWNMFGLILPFKILPIPLGGDISLNDISFIASRCYLRPQGIFVEPGYAAKFLLPGLALSLFGWVKIEKADTKNTILIFSALILTTSSQGIFIGALIIGMYIMSLVRHNKSYSDVLKKFIIILIRHNKSYSDVLKKFIIILIFLLLIVFFFNLSIVQTALNKVTGEIRSGSSVSLRMYRGFAVFLQLPIIFQIIGVGHGNLGNFVIKNSIVTRYDPAIITPAVADYANSVSAVLLYYGIIGFVLLIHVYWNFLKNTKGAFRLISICHIVMSFVAGGLFGVTMVFYFSLIYSGYNLRIQESQKST